MSLLSPRNENASLKDKKTLRRIIFLRSFFIERKADAGFTILELLMAVIVIGILSALALPSFLNQANKAKQSEAKAYIGSMNRAHQADYMERGEFTTDIANLGLGIQPETASYIYRITPGSAAGSGIVNRAIPSDGSFSSTPDSRATVLAYIGGVKAGLTNSSSSDIGTLSVICEAINPPVIAGGDSGEITEPGNLLSSSPGSPTCDPSTYVSIK